MRDDEPHPPSHLAIDAALLFVAKNSEQRKTRRRLVEGGGELIRHAQGFCVLLVDPRFQELGIWNAIANAVDFPDLEQEVAGRRGIEPYIFVKVTWHPPRRRTSDSRTEPGYRSCARHSSNKAMPPTRRRIPPTFATP